MKTTNVKNQYELSNNFMTVKILELLIKHKNITKFLLYMCKTQMNLYLKNLYPMVNVTSLLIHSIFNVNF